jgi:modulator of FtsH protease HflK
METKNGWIARAGAVVSQSGPWGGRGSEEGGGEGDSSPPPSNPWTRPPGGLKRPVRRGPSFLDEITKRFGGGGGGGAGGGSTGGLPGMPNINWRYALLAVGLVWVLLTSFHRIEPQQEGVVTRFGKYAGRLEPGIGMTLPAPIESVEKVDVRANNTTTIPENEGVNLVLTNDQNIVDLAYSVRWRKSNPENYLFELANPDPTVREAAESAMREVMGQVSLNDAFGRGRGRIEGEVTSRTQQLLNQYHAGVTVAGVSILHIKPPAEVVEAFNQVTVKQQQVQANINNANTYKQQILAKAQGEAAAFDKVYEQYRLAPGVTRKRMYYDTMESVLSNTDKTIVEPNAIAPYLPLGGANRPRVTVEEAPR